MTNPFLGKFNSIHRAAYNGALRPPNYSDLDDWYKNITDNTFNEVLNEDNAKILPSVFIGDDIGHYTHPTISLQTTGKWKIESLLFITGTYTPDYINLEGKETGTRWLINSNGNFVFRNDSNIGLLKSDVVGLKDLTGLNKITIEIDNLTYNIKVNDVSVDSGVIADLTYNFDGFLGSSTAVGMPSTVQAIHTKIYVNDIVTNYWVHRGEAYCIDVVGEDHAVGVNISTANKSYNVNGSLYLKDNGYQLFNTQSNGLGTDFQIPYLSNGNKLYDIAIEDSQTINGTLYYLISNHDAGNYHNLAESLIDFNYGNLVNVRLEIFDRSDITIYENEARAGNEYDASNPSRFPVKIISNPASYLQWFTINNDAKIFPKVLMDETKTKILRYYEELNYATNKSVDEQIPIYKYCNYTPSE